MFCNIRFGVGNWRLLLYFLFSLSIRNKKVLIAYNLIFLYRRNAKKDN